MPRRQHSRLCSTAEIEDVPAVVLAVGTASTHPTTICKQLTWWRWHRRRMLHCRWAYLQAWRRAVLIVALKVLDLTTSRTPTAERSRPPAQAATHPRCSQDGGAGGRGGLGHVRPAGRERQRARETTIPECTCNQRLSTLAARCNRPHRRPQLPAPDHKHSHSHSHRRQQLTWLRCRYP